jgi:hypothetical protein
VTAERVFGHPRAAGSESRSRRRRAWRQRSTRRPESEGSAFASRLISSPRGEDGLAHGPPEAMYSAARANSANELAQFLEASTP